MGGGGGVSSNPYIKGGSPPPNFFSALKASVWFKNKGGALAPLDLPLQELFPLIPLLFSLTLSILDISIRHTMVAVLVPCILDSGLNV